MPKEEMTAEHITPKTEQAGNFAQTGKKYRKKRDFMSQTGDRVSAKRARETNTAVPRWHIARNTWRED